MMPITVLKAMTGPRMWYLSLIHAVVYMYKQATKYGGATRHCEAASEKPMLSRRMRGRKYATPYVMAVKQLSSWSVLYHKRQVVRCHEQEDHAVAPDDQVFAGGDPGLEVPRLVGRVSSVCVDHGNDLLAIFSREEASFLQDLVWEINQGKIADDRNYNGDLSRR